MSDDLTIYDARVDRLLKQLMAIHETREDLFKRTGEALAESHVFARSMNGHLYAFDAKPLRQLVASLTDVCEMHEGVLRVYGEACAERDRKVAQLPVEAQAALAGLRLLPGGGGT